MELDEDDQIILGVDIEEIMILFNSNCFDLKYMMIYFLIIKDITKK